MIADLDARGSEELPPYDLCIIGTGPAGTTLVRELRDAGLRIAVLESGLTRPTARGDQLRRTVSTGIPIKEYSRERVLGGASTTWAGLSSPLDEVDVAHRRLDPGPVIVAIDRMTPRVDVPVELVAPLPVFELPAGGKGHVADHVRRGR